MSNSATGAIYEEYHRLRLQNKLETLLGSDHVYNQPPESEGLKYPCIIYSFEPPSIERADNYAYIITHRWHIKHIYKNLNQSLFESFLSSFQHITFDNRMVVDSIYNDDYTIYI